MQLSDLEAQERELNLVAPIRPASDCPFEEWAAWRMAFETHMDKLRAVQLWISIRRYDAAHPEEVKHPAGKGRGRRRGPAAEPVDELVPLEGSDEDFPEGGFEGELLDLGEVG